MIFNKHKPSNGFTEMEHNYHEWVDIGIGTVT